MAGSPDRKRAFRRIGMRREDKPVAPQELEELFRETLEREDSDVQEVCATNAVVYLAEQAIKNNWGQPGSAIVELADQLIAKGRQTFQ